MNERYSISLVFSVSKTYKYNHDSLIIGIAINFFFKYLKKMMSLLPTYWALIASRLFIALEVSLFIFNENAKTRVIV